MTPRHQPERAIQAHVIRLLKTVGAKVYTLGTVRRRGDHPGTMQTPGLPDLIAFLPARGGDDELLVVECKAPGGRLSLEQQRFRTCCHAARIDYVSGGLDDVLAWLAARGYVRREVTRAEG